MGVMYNARYFELCELGRIEWMRHHGMIYRAFEEELGMVLPVIHAECRYLAPLCLDDLAHITTSVPTWSAAKIVFESEVRREEAGELCARARLTLACVARGDRSLPAEKSDFKPRRWPEEFRGLLERVAPR